MSVHPSRAVLLQCRKCTEFSRVPVTTIILYSMHDESTSWIFAICGVCHSPDYYEISHAQLHFLEFLGVKRNIMAAELLEPHTGDAITEEDVDAFVAALADAPEVPEPESGEEAA